MYFVCLNNYKLKSVYLTNFNLIINLVVYFFNYGFKNSLNKIPEQIDTNFNYKG